MWSAQEQKYSRLSSLHLVMDRDSSIESGVRKRKNTDSTTPEQARVNRMKRKGVILEKRSSKQKN
ncbi:hypothetical protein C5167_024044 [Papaver somniferum]|uniref:Uncharacterized protein n=1 Tax=Papaver somniferum TaxID=3469 RepID=A0A4Y7JQE3_PAPSO|nr:hypothetical protein C5167_024044 [Papaver somniferum]